MFEGNFKHDTTYSGNGNTAGAGLQVKIGFPSEIILTPRDSASVWGGTKKMYFFGDIYYKDIFRDSHRIRFCMQFSPKDSAFLAYKKFNKEQ